MPYSEGDIDKAFRILPFEEGDTVFIHSNIGFFGKLKGAADVNALCSSFFKVIQSLIGSKGTIVVPAFTYSFPRKQKFNLNSQIVEMGIFSEWLRQKPDSLRSLDPSYSVVAWGEKAKFFTNQVPENSFGPDSFFDRFDKQEGVILNLNFDAGSTYLHYLERESNVSYRFDKTFEGLIASGDADIKSKSTIYVRYMHDLTHPQFEKFDVIARQKGKFFTSKLGRGEIGLIRARECREIFENSLIDSPYLLTRGSSLKVMPRFEKEQGYVLI